MPRALPPLRFPAGLALAAGLLLAQGAVQAGETSGLGADNFVDVGDSLTEVVATSGLAFSSLVILSAAAGQTRPRTASLAPPSSGPPAAQTVERACPGGGRIRATLLDRDRSGDLSVQDGMLTRFEACVVQGTVMNGLGESRVTAHRREGDEELTELAFRFTNLGSSELSWDGPARVVLRSDLRLGTDRYVVTYEDLAVKQGPHRMRWGFTLDVRSPPLGKQVASFQGAIALDALQLRLQQDEPFVIPGDGIPRTGQLTATDTAHARLQLEAGPWRYAYRWFRAGNLGEVPDAASQSRPHSQRGRTVPGERSQKVRD